MQGGRVHEAQGHEVDCRARDGGQRELDGVVQPLAAQVDEETEAVPAFHERGNLDEREDGDRERRPDGEPGNARLGAHAVDERVAEERGDGDDVHEHRAHRWPEVPTLGVEDAGEDRAQPVEDNLERKEPEEPDCSLYGVVARGREQALRDHDLRGEHACRKRDEPQEHDRDGEQVAHVVIGRLARVRVALLHVDGQKRRREHAARDKLVDHVRQVVCQRVGGGEEGVPQGECHSPSADEARDAGDENECGHHPRRFCD